MRYWAAIVATTLMVGCGGEEISEESRQSIIDEAMEASECADGEVRYNGECTKSVVEPTSTTTSRPTSSTAPVTTSPDEAAAKLACETYRDQSAAPAQLLMEMLRSGEGSIEDLTLVIAAYESAVADALAAGPVAPMQDSLENFIANLGTASENLTAFGRSAFADAFDIVRRQAQFHDDEIGVGCEATFQVEINHLPSI